jgi:hypothetical protein
MALKVDAIQFSYVKPWVFKFHMSFTYYQVGSPVFTAYILFFFLWGEGGGAVPCKVQNHHQSSLC